MERTLIRRLFTTDPHQAPAEALYREVVAQARQPSFYLACGVPDTLDGRFELVVLHTFLVLHRLRNDEAESADLAQALHDVLFRDMDRSLREAGVGDLGVGRRVKQMARALYGRCAAYEAGLAAEDRDLADALSRNLYGTVTAPPGGLRAMTAYLRREAAGLAAQDLAALMAGRIDFGAAPEGLEEGQESPAEGAQRLPDKGVDRP